jgi:hypothetical protein
MKYVLMFGAMAAILVSAVVANLLVLDVITIVDLRNTLGQTLLVIGISTTATLLMIGAGRLARARRETSSSKHSASQT